MDLISETHIYMWEEDGGWRSLQYVLTEHAREITEIVACVYVRHPGIAACHSRHETEAAMSTSTTTMPVKPTR